MIAVAAFFNTGAGGSGLKWERVVNRLVSLGFVEFVVGLATSYRSLDVRLVLMRCGCFVVSAFWVGPFSVGVFSACVGSSFVFFFLFLALLGNCVKGEGAVWCLLHVVLNVDELEYRGSTVSLCGFSCVVGLGFLIVLDVCGLVLLGVVVRFCVIMH